MALLTLHHALLQPTRRCLFSQAQRHLTTNAAEAAQQLLHAFKGQTIVRRQTLDGNQVQKLSLTLNRRHLHPGLDISDQAPPAGTPLPPGYHLVYFTSGGVESELGLDGTDKIFNAPMPFSRRMWAGGHMRWLDTLRVGEEVEERTALADAVAKKSRDGGEMVLVDVEKEFWVGSRLAVVDRRSWIFRPEALKTTPTTPEVMGTNGQTPFRGPSLIRDVISPGEGFPQRQFKWSPVGLFRFSALTFNAHLIHFNESWARSIDGFPGLIVHGPLNLINIMDYWRDIHGKDETGREISYRALSPVYAGELYAIRTANAQEVQGRKSWEIVADKAGTVCMRGEILSH